MTCLVILQHGLRLNVIITANTCSGAHLVNRTSWTSLLKSDGAAFVSAAAQHIWFNDQNSVTAVQLIHGPSDWHTCKELIAHVASQTSYCSMKALQFFQILLIMWPTVCFKLHLASSLLLLLVRFPTVACIYNTSEFSSSPTLISDWHKSFSVHSGSGKDGCHALGWKSLELSV